MSGNKIIYDKQIYEDPVPVENLSGDAYALGISDEISQSPIYLNLKELIHDRIITDLDSINDSDDLSELYPGKQLISTGDKDDIHRVFGNGDEGSFLQGNDTLDIFFNKIREYIKTKYGIESELNGGQLTLTFTKKVKFNGVIRSPHRIRYKAIRNSI